jgi:hypothetical protein
MRVGLFLMEGPQILPMMIWSSGRNGFCGDRKQLWQWLLFIIESANSIQ